MSTTLSRSDRDPALRGIQVLFYVGVPDVEAALLEAERLGGTHRLGPQGTPGTLVIGRSTDTEGNLVGVAGVR